MPTKIILNSALNIKNMKIKNNGLSQEETEKRSL